MRQQAVLRHVFDGVDALLELLYIGQHASPISCRWFQQELFVLQQRSN